MSTTIKLTPSGSSNLFIDDFNGIMNVKWDITSNCTVDDGKLTVTTCYPKTIIGGATWTDYSITTDIKINYIAAGIIFRAIDENNFYMWQFNSYTGKFRPHIVVAGAYTLLKEVDAGIVEDKYYKFKIEAKGFTIKTYIDGTLIDTTTDTNFTYGKIGFRQFMTESIEVKGIQLQSISAQETIKAYESVSIQQSTTDRAGTFTIILPFHATASTTAYVVGTDVQIQQEDHHFRGYVQNPPIVLNGPFKMLSLEGLEYSAKAQKIVVTESYTAGDTVSVIVADLVSTYLPWVTSDIATCDIVMDDKYPDKFLWDVLEKICSVVGYNWYIDENWVFRFFASSTQTNPAGITENNYHKGSASFQEDSSKLVNKLWVKGSKAISTTTASQTVTVTTANITLDYKPFNIRVSVGGVPKTVGIQNIDAENTKDFLLNFQEKLLIPDNVTTGTAVIIYNYEYPVKILLYNNESINTYGQVEDILKVNTGDRNLATQIGLTYLNKHANPILSGNISPFEGNYNAGELVNVNIPKLSINQDLVIKSVTYESYPTRPISIKLQLENRVDDITDILKQFSKRLDQLEDLNTNNNNELVEQYRTFDDSITLPILQDDGISYTVHEYLFTGIGYCGQFYI